MGMRIRTNIASIVSQRNLEKSTTELQDTMAKLSSGSRINKAADDAAGLAVSENLRGGIRSLATAMRNAHDGISMVQVAEGGLMETSNMLVRLRELAIQAASDTIGDKEREFLDKEFVQLKAEIDRIAISTEFNGTRLLVGNTPISDEARGRSNPFPLEVQIGKDYFSGADAADAANPVNVIKIDFSKLNGFTHGDGSLNLGELESGTRVNTKAAAQSSIANIDQAMYQISDSRSYLGAIQNRLGSTISNLGTKIENQSQTMSRIADTDVAGETARLTQLNILQQAGTAVLANANSQPQIALSLLK